MSTGKNLGPFLLPYADASFKPFWRQSASSMRPQSIPLLPASNVGPLALLLFTSSGPWFYAPPRGMTIDVDNPCEVCLLDIRGGLQGSNQWQGLVSAAGDVAESIQMEALWTRHECDDCSKLVVFQGQQVRVRAAVADGLTATRHRKCSIHGCTSPLIDLRAQTRCVRVSRR